MARRDWERMFWIFTQEDIFLYFNLTKGWLKTKNKTASPGDPAESIHMCMLDMSNWNGCTWGAPLAYAKFGSAMLHPETAEQVMWLHEWASVVTCTKVCKDLQRMLMPQPREHGSVLPLPLGRYFTGKQVWGPVTGSTVTGEIRTQRLGSHWVAYERWHT